MIEYLASIIPTSLIPMIFKKWESRKTRAEAWLAFAEAHFNEVWAYQIHKKSNKCSPRVVRFAYGCRWNSIENITASHETEGRVVIDGHFSYLVREDLAVQSRSFAYDRALLTTLIDDKVLRKGIGDKRQSNLVAYLSVYFTLGHREFFEKYWDEKFWSAMGIKNSEYTKAFNDEGQLDLDKYQQIVCDEVYQDTIEYKILKTHRDIFLNILKETEFEQYDAIQPNRLFGAQNNLTEYAREEFLLDLFFPKKNGNDT